MQTQKGRSGSSEAPKKVRPNAVRQLKTTGLDSGSSSSPNQVRTPKERSPKIVDRRSPRSPVTEKKRPSRISELESQVSQLADELKKAKDQLSLSESCKNEALEDAEVSKKQLVITSSKLEQLQKELLELSNSQSVEEASLASSTIDEIQQLKVQLETESDTSKNQDAEPESANAEIRSLKTKLMETLSLVENMKSQLMDSKNSEAEAQALARETLHQLETAKKSVEALRSDGSKSNKAYISIASELEQSKARVKELEELVSKLEKEGRSNGNSADDLYPIAGNGTSEKENQLQAEVERLRSDLELAERKYQQEQTQVRSAYELVEQIRSDSLIREAELAAELKQAKADVEELKADLMDKETELQGISEENDDLNMKLRSCGGESEIETELTRMKEMVGDKEMELKNILEENEQLKEAEREASVKLGLMMEEADRSSKRAARLTEQLEASQAANSEMEAEIRKMKVQSDQWRKAAEAAAAMITSGNNGNLTENNYEGVTGKMGSPYHEEMENEILRKRNGNMLKKIGVLWKKT